METEFRKEIFSPLDSEHAVFFDLDGTLADSIEPAFEAYLQFLASFNITGSRAEFEGFLGPTLKEIIHELKIRYHLPHDLPKLEAQYLTRMLSLYVSRVKPKRNAVKTVEALAKKGVRLFVVTSSPKDNTEIFLKNSNILQYFDGLVTAENSPRSKPAPDPYLHALTLAQLPPERCLAVEDTPNGVLSAKRAALQVVGIRGTSPEKEMTEAGAAPLVDDISDVLFAYNSRLIEWMPASTITVRHEKEKFKSAVSRKQIDEIWNLENSKRTQPFFNGSLAIVRRIDKTDQSVDFGIDFIDYKTYIAYRHYRKTEPSRLEASTLKTLGVTGIVTLTDNGNSYVVLGRRAPQTTLYPLEFETIPTGTLDRQQQDEKNQVDYLHQIREEFEEETALDQKYLSDLSPFGVLYDNAENAYDACCTARLMLSREEAIRRLKPTPEYSEFVTVETAEIRSFILDRFDEISRPTITILQMLASAQPKHR